MVECDVAIVGGGASGLAVAAMLSEKTKLSITVVESCARAGKKLAASGNGQGNVSNAHMSADKYFGGGAKLALDILSGYGDSWKYLFYGKFTCDSQGRIYPAGKQASALTDCLLKRLKNGGVNLITGEKVVKIDGSDVFLLKLSGGEIIKSRYVVLCTGGKAQKQFGTDGSSYALAEKFGHKVTALYPSLVQLKTDTSDIKTLRGIRADCIVTAFVNNSKVADFRGDVIFTEYGVSGNAIFNISAYVADKKGVSLELDFAPDFTTEDIENDILLKKSRGYEDSELLACTLNNQIGRAVIKRSGNNVKKIAYTVKHFALLVTGSLGFDYAQVTKGGIDISGVKDNLESRYKDNLFFAGEILDVDGACGGYNLTWAFASAAKVAAEIEKRQ
ncbi:MAG: aminoacetone oxidase family FAD-binding enzyme [Clostridia bacterium]|nr:aminoacetone oxidase family FAD-binding enzyme [Clostridia bacterium]